MSQPYRLLGGFRAVLALMVVLQHALRPMAPPSLAHVLQPFEVGGVAVLIFFALSGFIVSEAALRIYDGRPYAFATNRLLRIYPTYLVALLLTVLAIAALDVIGETHAIVAFGIDPELTAGSVAANVFSIVPGGNLLHTHAGAPQILEIAWALRIELLFYAFLFALVLLAARVDIPLEHVLVSAIAALIAFYAVGRLDTQTHALQYIPYFTFGVALYLALAAQSAQRRIVPLLVLLASYVLIARHMLGQDPMHHSGFLRDLPGQFALLNVGFAVWALLLALPRLMPLSAGFTKWDRFVGECTYPLYLTHLAALLVIDWLLPTPGVTPLLIGVASSLVVAVVTATTFERWIGRLRAGVRGFSLKQSESAAGVVSPRVPVSASN